MATNSQQDNNYNNMDFNQLYGLPNTSWLPQSTTPTKTTPSIKDIASYQIPITAIAPAGGSSAIPSIQQIASKSLPETLTEPDVNQMYSPITKTAIIQTPTPANTVGDATISPFVDETLLGGITDIENPYPVTSESLQFLNGFIRTQIGRRVTIDFLVGSNMIETKSGYLLGVASNYILLNELESNNITACDYYNIKFICFFY